MVSLKESAKQQRSISVAEFFEKNKHLLGFDSPTRGVITTIKEAVDNALDACEEAQVLPDRLHQYQKNRSRYLQDYCRGQRPGHVRHRSLLFLGNSWTNSCGSTRSARPGASRVSVFLQPFSTRRADKRSGPLSSYPAPGQKNRGHRFEIQIKIETNEPDILSLNSPFEWDRIHVPVMLRSSSRARCRQKRNCSNISGIPRWSTPMPGSG